MVGHSGNSRWVVGFGVIALHDHDAVEKAWVAT